MEINLENLRLDIVSALYQADLLKSNDIYIENEVVNQVFEDIINNLDEIDDIISDTLFNYTIDRLSFIDRAIIRLAVYEMKFTELAAAIIINEAIELTKTYSDLDDEKQHKFNNKLLDNLNKAIREWRFCRQKNIPLVN